MKYEHICIIAPILIVTLFFCFVNALIVLVHAGHFLFGTAIDIILLLAMIGLLVSTFDGWVKASIAAQGPALPIKRSQTDARAIEQAVEYVRDIGWLDSEPRTVAAEWRDWYAAHGIYNTIWAVTSDRCGNSQEVTVWTFFQGIGVGLRLTARPETYTSEASVMARGEAMENAVGSIRRYEELGCGYDDRVYALMVYAGTFERYACGWRVYLNVGTSEPVIRVDMDAYTGKVITAFITERPLGVVNHNDAEIP